MSMQITSMILQPTNNRRCVSDQEAVTTCTDPNCKLSRPFMCDIADCQCRRNHALCDPSCSVQIDSILFKLTAYPQTHFRSPQVQEIYSILGLMQERLKHLSDSIQSYVENNDRADINKAAQQLRKDSDETTGAAIGQLLGLLDKGVYNSTEDLDNKKVLDLSLQRVDELWSHLSGQAQQIQLMMTGIQIAHRLKIRGLYLEEQDAPVQKHIVTSILKDQQEWADKHHAESLRSYLRGESKAEKMLRWRVFLSMKTPPSLRVLSLTSLGIQNLQFLNYLSLQELRTLVLSNNAIRSIAALKNLSLPCVEEIYLDHNDIQDAELLTNIQVKETIPLQQGKKTPHK